MASSNKIPKVWAAIKYQGMFEIFKFIYKLIGIIYTYYSNGKVYVEYIWSMYSTCSHMNTYIYIYVNMYL